MYSSPKHPEQMSCLVNNQQFADQGDELATAYDQWFHIDSVKLNRPPIAMTGTDISPCGVV
jgi:hypothetical protein